MSAFRFWLFAGLLFFVCCAVQGRLWHVGFRLDFASFYYGARVAADGLNPYDHDVLDARAATDPVFAEKGRSIFPYLYPPVLAALFRPFLLVSRATAETLWGWLSAVFLAGAGVLTARMAAGRDDAQGPRAASVLAATAALLLLPVRANLRLGQVNPLPLLALAGCLFLLLRQRRNMGAGAWLALAASIKVTPVLFALLVPRKGALRFLSGIALGALGLLAFTAILGEARMWPSFFASLPQTGYGRTIPGLFDPAHVWNLSLAGLLLRLGGPAAALVKPVTMCLVLLMAAMTAGAWWRARDDEARRLVLLPMCALMVMAAPYAWNHHVIFLLPGLVCALAHIGRTYRGSRRILLLAATVALTLGAGTNLENVYARLPETASGFMTSLSVYALLGLYALGFVLYGWHRRATDEQQAAMTEGA